MQQQQLQQQQQQQQQQNMTADRSLLGEKELLYIHDFLSWELLAMKKCSEAAGMIQDQQLQQSVRQIGQKHQQHFETILNHLQ